MKGSIASGLQHVLIATQYFEDFIRQQNGKPSAKLFTQYVNRLKWIPNDLLTNHKFGEKERETIRKELNADVMAVASIHEKIALLNPDLRLNLETMIEDLLIQQKTAYENAKEMENCNKG